MLLSAEVESRLESLENAVAQQHRRSARPAAPPKPRHQPEFPVELEPKPEPELEPEPEPELEEAETIALEVVCPEDGVAGDTLSIHIGREDDGEESSVDIEIPEGVEPGETFEVHIAR